MNGQRSFDRGIARAMTRRQFLARLARASAAATLVSSTLGCGKVRGAIARLGSAEEPIFNSVQEEVVEKIIDGFNPPDTEIRQRLAREDPDYDPVAVYAQYAWASGDEFLAGMRFLVDFVNVLPTFTRTFSTRYGLPARLELRRFHPVDANRYFLFLRDSNIRALRNIFSGARFIGTAPIYVNEKVTWKAMNYPGPWVRETDGATADLARTTSFDMAEETEDNVAALRRRVVRHDALGGGLEAARVVDGDGRLVLETDVVVVGSGAGGSFVAAELAAKTKQRILVLEKGEFIEPAEFLQRERLMMPRMFDTEFSVVEVFGRSIPTVSAAVVTGKLVGGSATINHALAFEPPRPVIRDWRDLYGAELDYEDLEPHFAAIHKLLRIAPVPESQIAGSNLALRRGVQAMGLPHHGPAQRNAHQCIGCGFCDLGCRYNRKLTPLNMVLPLAARNGAQVLANCRVDQLLLEALPDDGRAGRTHRATGVVAHLTDARGRDRQRVEIRARRVVLAAGPFASPRILMQSGVSGLRLAKGSERAVGERFSTHATTTFFADFDQALYPSAATPPMGYFVKKYEVEDQGRSRPRPRPLRPGRAAEPSPGHGPAGPVRVGGESPRVHETAQSDHDPRGDVPRSAGRPGDRQGLRVRAGRGGPARVAGRASDGRPHHVRGGRPPRLLQQPSTADPERARRRRRDLDRRPRASGADPDHERPPHGRLRARGQSEAGRGGRSRPLLGRGRIVRGRLLHPPDVTGRQSVLHRVCARPLHRARHRRGHEVIDRRRPSP